VTWLLGEKPYIDGKDVLVNVMCRESLQVRWQFIPWKPFHYNMKGRPMATDTMTEAEYKPVNEVV